MNHEEFTAAIILLGFQVFDESCNQYAYYTDAGHAKWYGLFPTNILTVTEVYVELVDSMQVNNRSRLYNFDKALELIIEKLENGK